MAGALAGLAGAVLVLGTEQKYPATLGAPYGFDGIAMALIGQEVTQESYVDIPEEVLDVYRLWRPTPLYRAHRLERALGVPEGFSAGHPCTPRSGVNAFILS